MSDRELDGRRALVTGASSGLGADFARELANRGADLVLVARRRTRLDSLAEELIAGHGVAAKVVEMDLADPAAPRTLFDRLAGTQVDILVNNAGFGIYGDFADTPWERESRMLQLNIVTLVHLTKLFLLPMRERGWGRILQVASTGAFQPSPGYAAYSATKAFVLSFGEAVSHELRGSGVSCTVVSPGVTRTEFLKVAGQEKGWFHHMTMMESMEVAQAGIDAMLAGKPSTVTGWLNRANAFTIRLMPRRMATAVSAMAMDTERK